MPSSTAVLKRMDQRVGKLTDRFDEYVRVFGTSERFTGPSGYFHRKALALRAQHQGIASLLKDDACCRSLKTDQPIAVLLTEN